MISFIRGSLDSNATFLTMADHFKGDAVYACGERVSFSSARKWSALELKGPGHAGAGRAGVHPPGSCV